MLNTAGQRASLEGALLGRTTLSLRLFGDLPPTEELSGLLGVEPTSARRRGEDLAGGLGTQKEDVWLLRLGVLGASEEVGPSTRRGDAAGSESGTDGSSAVEAGRVAGALRGMAPALAALDKARLRAELYAGAVERVARNEHETYAGGFLLPDAVVAAVAECGLEIRVSTLTIVEREG